jgi:hypothetical protein
VSSSCLHHPRRHRCPNRRGRGLEADILPSRSYRRSQKESTPSPLLLTACDGLALFQEDGVFFIILQAIHASLSMQ